jgi:hypothetical protein
MLFKTNPVNLSELIEHVRVGKIQLPDFQRPWVWDDERIAALLATVARGYPLGVMMTLETSDSGLKFRPKPLEGVELASPVEPEELLMDGQQRLTSLFQALASGQPVDTMDTRRKRLLRWYYIDIARAVDLFGDMEDAIVSVPADRRHEFRDEGGKRVTLDLTTQEAEVASGMFPLRLIYVPKDLSGWRRAYEKIDPDRWDFFEEKILKQIDTYQVPVIQLTKDASKEAVCAVFENVNTRGVALTVFELLTASYAAESWYEREQGRYFHLPEDWAATRERLGRHDTVREIDDTDFLRAITLVSTHYQRRGQPGVDPFRQPAASSKRKDILNLELAEYLRWAPAIESALKWSAAFLARQGIFAADDLPYRSQISALAAIRTVLGADADRADADEKIARWFWCGVLGEQYSGSLDSRLPRDLEQVAGWVLGEKEPTSVTEATFNAARLDTMSTRNSAAYKGVCGLLLRQGVIDWTYSKEPINETILFDQDVNIEPFSSRLCLAELQYVDGLGELAGAPGAAAELPQDVPGLELRVCPFPGSPQFRVGAVGVFLGFGLVLALVRDLRPGAALVALIGQGDQAGGLQLGHDAPDPLGALVVDRAGQRAGDPQQVTVRAGDDLQVHAVPLVLAGVERAVPGDPVDRDQRPVHDHVGVPGLPRVPDGLAQLRGAGREQLHDLLHVPPGRGGADLEPGREIGERLALAQVGEHEEGLLPGTELPPQRADRGPVAADDPGHVVEGLGRQRQRGTVKQHEGAPGWVEMTW